MSGTTFNIDPRLDADSHPLFSYQHCEIRLQKNASLLWVIIIPQTNVIEFCDLSDHQQLTITQVAKQFGDYFKANFGAEKINFAAIGNVVQQLHIHVIGRHSKDPLWPDVVWGNSLPELTYSTDELFEISAAFKKLLGVKQ